MTIGATESRNEPFVWVNLEFCELNIDPASKAVYLEIVRRARRSDRTGACWESVEHIAYWANVSVAVAKRSLKQLIEWNMISREPRPGFSSWYTLLDRSLWTAPKLGNPPQKQERGRTKKGGSNLAQVKNELAQIKPSSEKTQVKFEAQNGKGGSNLAHPGGSNLAHELDHYELDPEKKELDPYPPLPPAGEVNEGEDSESVDLNPDTSFSSGQLDLLPNSNTLVETESSANLSQEKKETAYEIKLRWLNEVFLPIYPYRLQRSGSSVRVIDKLIEKPKTYLNKIPLDVITSGQATEALNQMIEFQYQSFLADHKKEPRRVKPRGATQEVYELPYIPDPVNWFNESYWKREYKKGSPLAPKRFHSSHVPFTPPPEPETPQDYISPEEARRKFEEFQRKLKAAG